MKPEKLIIVRKTADPVERQYHAKGKLNGHDKTEDPLFLQAIVNSHDGISAARYTNQCCITVSLYKAYVDDWPEVNQLVFGFICGRLGWLYKKTTIRHYDTSGKLENGHKKHFRLQSKEATEKQLDDFLIVSGKAAGNVPSDA
jgi:hypothetical protein